MISVRSEVQAFPGPPAFAAPESVEGRQRSTTGAIAQLGERLLCKQEVVGSIPSGSTSRDFKLVRTTNSRPFAVWTHEALVSWDCDRRVTSDIVKRRSFRVSIVVLQEIAAGAHSRHFV